MTGKLPATIRGVLFDLDNTLYDRDGAFVRWAQWFARERLRVAHGTESAEVVDRIVALDASGRGPKDAVFRHLKERYPILVDELEALIVAFRTDLLAHLGPLDEDTVHLLGALDDAGMPWGIVTNGFRNLLRKIERLGLNAQPRYILVSEMEGWRKPAPEIFRVAAGRLGIEPPSILFVGDNPEDDVVGAARAGMRTAWLRRGREWPTDLAEFTPNHLLDTMGDLLRLVQPARA